MHSLSVIIPCYNSEKTLEEAVLSVFRQQPGIPFELTLVDDGSTDSTYALMQRVARDHTNVNLIQLQENLGGGAARNAGAAGSKGDLLFCLDSDDMLGPDFLRNMIAFWSKKQCDALGMSTSIKFRRADIRDVAYVDQFANPGKRVPFESFLDGTKCSLSVVFLMTRRAFDLAGGYPTEHGFDTQGMGFRILCNGLQAYTCPETVYYHRVAFGPSYYLREQAAERLNWNWLNVLDEYLYLFQEGVQRKMLESDLFQSPGGPVPDSMLGIVHGKTGIYARGYRGLVQLGRDAVARRLRGSQDGFQQYWLGRYYGLKGDPQRAIGHYTRALSLGFSYRIIYYRLLAASLDLSGRQGATSASLAELIRYSSAYPVERLPIHQRVFRRALASPVLRSPALLLKAVKDLGKSGPPQ